MKYVAIANPIVVNTKLIKSPPSPALSARGVRVNNSIVPNE